MGTIDPGRALKYFGFAADRGDVRATLFLADLYYTGRGVAKDVVEGDRLAEKAAARAMRKPRRWSERGECKPISQELPTIPPMP